MQSRLPDGVGLNWRAIVQALKNPLVVIAVSELDGRPAKLLKIAKMSRTDSDSGDGAAFARSESAHTRNPTSNGGMINAQTRPPTTRSRSTRGA
jgi:hypothetical protein